MIDGHLVTEKGDEVAQSEDATVLIDLVIVTRVPRADEAIIITIGIRIGIVQGLNVRNGHIEVVMAHQVLTNQKGIPAMVVVAAAAVTNVFKMCLQRNIAFSHNRQGIAFN